jgi:aspartate-semialdehyde dehydrogenase
MAGLPTLAVVGATGAVGTVMLELISSRKNVWGEIRVVASVRSAGRTVSVRGEDLTLRTLEPTVFDGVDVAMLDLPDDIAAEWAPVAAERGATVVDTSGAFRLDPDVPLVVPEINLDQIHHRPRGIVACPNSTTMTMIVALGALHREYVLRELVVASYQAASSTGQSGVDTLLNQIQLVAADPSLGLRSGNLRRAVGDDLGPFPAPLALNVVPWAGSLREGGWSSEEFKLRNETRKILGLPDLKVAATCVRVPVITGHSLAVHAVFRSEVDPDRAREVIDVAPGVIVVDDPAAGEFPTPADAVGTDPTWVGRVRRSPDDPRALDFFVSGDNLRKGAALNSVQIAEHLAAARA